MSEEEIVNVDVLIEKNIILELALEAHRRDMKFNDFLVEILMEAARTDIMRAKLKNEE